MLSPIELRKRTAANPDGDSVSSPKDQTASIEKINSANIDRDVSSASFLHPCVITVHSS